MPESPRAQATLLLTLSLQGDATSARVLTTAEWSRLSRWLHGRGLAPESLLETAADAVLADWSDSRIPRERLERLLDRRFALAVAAERWESTGVWFVTRGEPDYPVLLRTRLRDKAPPFLCGAGERSLLSRPLIAIVGSRHASPEALANARELARALVQSGQGVVSGAARGIDSEAMQAAIDAGGYSVGVLADELLKASRGKQWRDALIEGRLALVSQFGVERRFSVGHAMARNKIIYCIAQRAVVVATTHGHGGTWSGAVENLQQRWVELFVHVDATGGQGVAELKGAGARTYEHPGEVHAPGRELDSAQGALTTPVSTPVVAAQVAEPVQEQYSAHTETAVLIESYEAFMHRLEALLSGAPKNAKSIAAELGLTKRLTDEWIRRAREAGMIRMSGRDREYHLVAIEGSQRELFSAPDPSRSSS